MRVHLIVLLLYTIYISTLGLEISDQLFKSSNAIIAKLITQGFVHRLKTELIKISSASDQEPSATILPPIADPAYLDSIEIPLDISGIPYFESTGAISYCTPEVTGLSKLTENFVLNPIGEISINWDIDIPTIAIQGRYKLDQIVNSSALFIKPIPHKIYGDGQLFAGVDEVFLRFSATGKVLVGPIHLNTLSIDFGFKNLTTHGENTQIDEKPFSFDILGQLIQLLFGFIWSDTTKPIINEMVMCSINHVIGGCTLNDLTSGNLDCLDVSLDTKCFGSEAEFEFFDDISIQEKGYCDTLLTTTTVDPTATTQGPITSTDGQVDPLTSTEGQTPSSTSVSTETTSSTSPEDTTTEKSDASSSGLKCIYLFALSILISLSVTTNM